MNYRDLMIRNRNRTIPIKWFDLVTIAKPETKTIEDRVADRLEDEQQ